MSVLFFAVAGVLVGFASLVVSLVTENSGWAWGCIAACSVSAVILIVDARSRRSARNSSVAGEGPAVDHAEVVPAAESAAVVVTAEPELAAEPEPAVIPEPEPAVVPELAVEPEPERAAEPELVSEDSSPADSPDPNPAADPGLDHDVFVVDEYPRFHARDCTWLVGRETMTLPAREAVELGFTPCSRCAPAHTLTTPARV